MSKTPPFTASAHITIPFIPSSQDVDRYSREQRDLLDKRTAALERERAAYYEREGLRAAGEPPTEDEEAFSAEEAKLEEDRAFVERNIATMTERWGGKPQTFILAQPTAIERDMLQSRMNLLGLRQVTSEETRATMIEEVYREDWSEPGEEISAEENAARADDNANFLDSFWQRQEANEAAIARWREQEIERTIDELEGAPRTERAELPAKIVTVREEARNTLLASRIMQRPAMRKLIADSQDFARANAILLVRLHLVGVENIDTDVPIVRDPRLGAVSEEAVNALREQVDDHSWNELIGFIDRMYSVDGTERKNSDSPLEKPSHPSGSIEQSGEQDPNNGSSTRSFSEPAPDAGSEKTTAKSSRSTSGAGTGRASKVANGSQTDGA